jgi:hypothetical protein
MPGMNDFPEPEYNPINVNDEDYNEPPKKKGKQALCCSLCTLIISIPALIGA